MKNKYETNRLFFTIILFGFFLQAFAQTSLTVEFVDNENEPVALSQAELLLVAWGVTERLEIPINDGNKVELFLDKRWIRSQRPEWGEFERAFLYVQAKEFVPVRSGPFSFLGPNHPTFTEVLFPNGQGAKVDKGAIQHLHVVLRRPQPRYLRLLDLEGQPVPEVGVTVGMFWSASNHCGVLAGNDPMANLTSDSAGLVVIPDGDIEYSFVFDKPGYTLEGSSENIFKPSRWVTYLDGKETVVRMRKLVPVSLSLKVFENHSSSSGRILMGRLNNSYCGAYWGPIATVNPDNEVQVSNFYPEAYSEIYFESDDGRLLWKRNVNELNFEQSIPVHLAPLN